MSSTRVYENTLPAIAGNFFGAFADAAILFPLIALLSTKSGFSGPNLLLSAGVSYIVASVWFKIPMAVQPLKSIAIAAVSVGASLSEVRISCLLLGIVCVILSVIKFDTLSKKVPPSLIHQIQLGLGILLIRQGYSQYSNSFHVVFGLEGIFICLFTLLIVICSRLPFLGVIATIGLGYSIISPHVSIGTATTLPHLQSLPLANKELRFELILNLLIPQILLTLANSVLSTKDVCQRVFGKKASRVTLKRLLQSIGYGNILSAAVCGLPFCHGSGGITAHAKGGSTKSWSTILTGVVLIIFALLQLKGHQTIINLPRPLLSTLLFSVGIAHLQMAKPTFNTSNGSLKIFTSALVTIFTSNLLWVLVAGVFIEVLEAFITQKVLVLKGGIQK